MATSTSSIELAHLRREQNFSTNPSSHNSLHEESAPPVEQLALPPADHGKGAYLCLTAAFMLEGMIWSFPFSFGVFQEYYASHPQFSHDISSIAAIGTTATGLMYFLAPVVYAGLRKAPRWRKTCSMVGFVIMTAALVGASFAQSVSQLLGMQGVLYGIGGAICYFPVFSYLDEWWIARKGLAYGVVWAGGGAAGIVLPLTMKWLLDSYGYQTTLRVWAVTNAALVLPFLFALQGRLPARHAATGPQKIEWGFLKHSAFWVMQAGNMIQGLGYYMPSLYLPSFARAVGLSSQSGTIAISLINAANVVGGVGAGFITDHYHVTTAVSICALGTLSAVFLFWTFAVYTPVLFVFAIMYGIFAGGYAATWTGVVTPIRQTYPAVDTGMIIAMFAAGKGVGSVISGPLSGFLVRSDAWKSQVAYGFGSGYGYLIVFSGVTAGLSMMTWCGKKYGLV